MIFEHIGRMLTDLELASLQAPRYTSYPTAPHFDAEIGAGDYAQFLQQTPENEPLSLYFHVPYCRSLCHYCGCHTKATLKNEPVEAYRADLDAELALVADHLGTGRKVSHIHWGGGTPSILGGEKIAEFAERIGKLFSKADDCEHAIELDPRYVTGQMARQLADCGVNRVSLGIQDFNPHVQVAIGRIQPFDLVVAVVERLRRAGITDINFDLMYGLPAQSTAHMVATIEHALSMEPSRIALFGYAHVPWFMKNQRLIDEALLPDTAMRLEQAEVATETIQSAGYDVIGLDHFARPDDPLSKAAKAGTLRRNFQGYTNDDASTLIGMGTSAIGQFNDGYVQNDPAAGNWSRAIKAGTLGTKRGYRLSDEDRARRRIIEQIMCQLEARPFEVVSAYKLPVSILDKAFERLSVLEETGHVVVEDGIVRIPETSRHFMRLAAAAFDANHNNGASTRHAKAV